MVMLAGKRISVGGWENEASPKWVDHRFERPPFFIRNRAI